MTANGVEMDPEKLEAVQSYPVPVDAKSALISRSSFILLSLCTRIFQSSWSTTRPD